MRIIKRLIPFILLLFLTTPSFAATTTAVGHKLGEPFGPHGITALRWDFTCVDATGLISGGAIEHVTGKIVGMLWVPGTGTTCHSTGGSPCYPDDDGDIEIRATNYNNVDILNGAGDDLPDGLDGADVDDMFVYPVDGTNGGPITVYDATLSFWGSNLSATNSNCKGVFYLFIDLY